MENAKAHSTKPPTLWRLFWVSLRLSAFTFGGGYVIVPLMQRTFSEKYGWLSEKEIADQIAIAQSAPGIIAVNASLMAGFGLRGLPGALVCLAGTVLPPLVIMLVIYYAYAQFSANIWVQRVLYGFRIGAAAVLVDAVVGMIVGIVKQKNVFTVCVLVSAFAAVFVLHVPVWAVLLSGGIAGWVYCALREKKRGI
ncbi:MAG: chromate transporter [Oscillospiraceae bacterium]|jgi:chromate transporter|nr:chromate transporter [Oscillospiraceae bacterium]